MSPRRRAPKPAFATEGAGDATTAWEAMPRRRLASLGKWRNPIGMVGAAIIVFNVLVALFGPYVWTVDPNELVGLRFEALSWAHPMGTDEIGRDTLARIIHGAKVSLYVGAISVSIAFVGGVVFGMLAGYYKGIVDTAPDAHRRHHVLAARDRPCNRDRRPPRPEPPERDDRDRDRDPARLRAGRAGRGARGDGLSVHRVGPCARSGRLADHAASRDPQHRRAAARARHGLPVGRDPGRSGTQLPRARHAAAGGVVGRDAEHGSHATSTSRRGCRSSPALRS